MSVAIDYRRGKLADLSRLEISSGLSATKQSLEFNILGMGHELWIAVAGSRIIGLCVLGRPGSNEFKVMYLEVAPSQKNQGVGSGLMRAILANHPDSEFSVVPFEGTEEFYRRFGFDKVSRWEMHRPRSNPSETKQE